MEPVGSHYDKEQRKVMTLCEEINRFDTSARSESAAPVGRHYGINELTVVPVPQTAKVSFKSHDHHIERMEKALNVWNEDQTEKDAFEWNGVWQ
uniref:Uncharacterized protein n=1 Tax=Eptatretus burgeri TaxID=7764 RepID=A0A8C4Q7A3_EPTBU